MCFIFVNTLKKTQKWEEARVVICVLQSIRTSETSWVSKPVKRHTVCPTARQLLGGWSGAPRILNCNRGHWGRYFSCQSVSASSAQSERRADFFSSNLTHPPFVNSRTVDVYKDYKVFVYQIAEASQEIRLFSVVAFVAWRAGLHIYFLHFLMLQK